MMKKFALCVLLALFLSPAPQFAHAANQGVVATVNDIPITTLDIQQRLSLLKILGDNPRGSDPRKFALNMMVDEIVKIAEAKKYKMEASDKEIGAQVARMAKGLKTDANGFENLLKKNGIETSSLKQLIAAQIAFSRIVGSKYQVKFEVDQAEVDKKMAEIKSGLDQKVSAIMKDERMKPVQIYTILEVDLPVETPNDPMLLQARAVEAGQFIKKFKGCGSARAAASGIFNVKIGKTIDAVAAKIPGPMKQALEKAGPGGAMGPARSAKGIQVIGFCSKKIVTPPKPKYELPDRKQVEAFVSNEKYEAIEAKYIGEMRKHAYVEYKDPAYAQQ
jgi:peptidyl-prolyl cis-trans isomerase SurA